MIMPLRGLLFKKIEKARAVRRAKEFSASREEAKKEGIELKELRKRRVQQEGKALLEETLSSEKRRLVEAKKREKIARGPGIATKIGKLLISKGKKAAVSPTTRKGTRLIAKELGIVKTKKPGRKKKRKKRKPKNSSVLGSGPFI